MASKQEFLTLFKENLEKNIASNKDNILEIIDSGLKENFQDGILIVNNDEGTTTPGFLNYSISNYKINYLNDNSALLTGQVELYYVDDLEMINKHSITQTIITYKLNDNWDTIFTQIMPLSFGSLSKIDYQSVDEGLDRIRYKMFSDGLTEVLNREGFEARATKLLQNYNPENVTALFMIDLDDFKQINDNLGHPIGDLVLRQVANTLKKIFRNSDAVGRMGGDEFMVMLNGNFSQRLLQRKAEELLSSIAIEVDKEIIPVSVSIGLAYGKSHVTFEKLYHMADTALYRSKKSGKCCYHAINVDTNFEQISFDSSNDIISLQTLIDNNGKINKVEGKTPYDVLVENIPGSVLIFSFTDRVRIMHVNKWTSRFTGYSIEELNDLQKDDIMSITHPDDQPMLKEIISKIYGGLDEVHSIFRLKRKDSSYVHVAIDASMTERTKNEIIFHGIETDVEELFKLKQEIEIAHKRLSNLLDTIPTGVLEIIITDNNLSLVHCNNWVARFLGYTQLELNNMEENNPYAIVFEDDLRDVIEGIKRMKIAEDRVEIFYRLIANDGSLHPVFIVATLTEKTDDKIIYHGVVASVHREFKSKDILI
ncbi:diguanylate cyclase domain-containing protein [Anaerorhabdus sp.]|uniref:diguanylate cyclase domain-containing protein n=1 Tax=Anaerorhabdus sp. TaxID=1872524 RepID=UPI002FCAB0DD